MRNITQRFSVRYPEALRKMADYLTDTLCAEINYKSLAKQFSFKSRERIRNEKNYVIDTAFISTAKEGFSEQNFGWRLENIVCIELFRRRNSTLNDVYYSKMDMKLILC